MRSGCEPEKWESESPLTPQIYSLRIYNMEMMRHRKTDMEDSLEGQEFACFPAKIKFIDKDGSEMEVEGLNLQYCLVMLTEGSVPFLPVIATSLEDLVDKVEEISEKAEELVTKEGGEAIGDSFLDKCAEAAALVMEQQLLKTLMGGFVQDADSSDDSDVAEHN